MLVFFIWESSYLFRYCRNKKFQSLKISEDQGSSVSGLEAEAGSAPKGITMLYIGLDLHLLQIYEQGADPPAIKMKGDGPQQKIITYHILINNHRTIITYHIVIIIL